MPRQTKIYLYRFLPQTHCNSWLGYLLHVHCYMHRGLNHMNTKNISVEIGSCSPFIVQPSVLVAYSDKMKTDMTVFIRFLSNQSITSIRITFYAVFLRQALLCHWGYYFKYTVLQWKHKDTIHAFEVSDKRKVKGLLPPQTFFLPRYWLLVTELDESLVWSSTVSLNFLQISLLYCQTTLARILFFSGEGPML